MAWQVSETKMVGIEGGLKGEEASPQASSRRTNPRIGGTSSTAPAALLDATAALMRERDTLDVSFVEIGRRAGLPPGLIGYYFGNKEGLLHALLERDVRDAVGRLDRLVNSSGSPTEKMRLHIRGVATAFHRSPYFNRLLQSMTRDAEPGRVTAIINALVQPIVAAQGKIIDEGIASGEFRRVDKMLFYFSVIGAADALYSSRFIVDRIYDIKVIDRNLHNENAAHLANFLVKGLTIK